MCENRPTKTPPFFAKIRNGILSPPHSVTTDLWISKVELSMSSQVCMCIHKNNSLGIIVCQLSAYYYYRFLVLRASSPTFTILYLLDKAVQKCMYLSKIFIIPLRNHEISMHFMALFGYSWEEKKLNWCRKISLMNQQWPSLI